MEPKVLPSNEFWGRRSGQIIKTKDGEQRVFRQQQFGAGSGGAGKAFNSKLINVPRKWFGKNYKSKRGIVEVTKGMKKK